MEFPSFVQPFLFWVNDTLHQFKSEHDLKDYPDLHLMAGAAAEFSYFIGGLLFFVAFALLFAQVFIFGSTVVAWRCWRTTTGRTFRGGRLFSLDHFRQAGPSSPLGYWTYFNYVARRGVPPVEYEVYAARPDVEFRNGQAFLLVDRPGDQPFLVSASCEGVLYSRVFPGSNPGQPSRLEMAIAGSPLPFLNEPPKVQLEFWADGTLVGHGFRLQRYVVTAKHVYDHWVHSGERVLRARQKAVPLTNIIRKISTPNKLDLAIFEVDANIFTTLEVRTADLGFPVAGMCALTPRNLNQYETSYGRIERNEEEPRLMRHTMSTKPGFSGAPVIQDGRVVAIHLGSLPEMNRNYCLSLRDVSMFIESGDVEPDYSKITESDIPGKSVDRWPDEELRFLSEKQIHALTNPKMSNRRGSQVYDAAQDLIWGPREKGFQSRVKELIDDLEELIKLGDESAEIVLRDIRVNILGENVQTVVRESGIKGPEPAFIAGSSLPGSTSSTEQVSIPGKPRVTLKRQTQVESAFDSAAHALQFVPKQSTEFAQLSKQLSDLKKDWDLLLEGMQSSQSSGTSTTRPAVGKPSSNPFDSNLGDSQEKKSEKLRSRKQTKQKSPPDTLPGQSR